MRALVIGQHGPPKNLEIQQRPDPQPKTGEVLVRVKAVGVNFADLMQRMGIYPGGPKPPFVPGMEVAGVVERLGEGPVPPEAQDLKAGDAVVALLPHGGYAEWAA